MADSENEQKTINLGSKKVRLHSIEHLRFGNRYANCSKEQLLPILEAHKDEKHGAVALAIEQLKQSGPNANNKVLVKFLIYQGHMYGLGASPAPSQIADMLWQAAAIIVEKTKLNPQRPTP
jgi:hypothetical protein